MATKRLNFCSTRKYAYSKKEAIGRAKYDTRTHGELMMSYKCKECGEYHVAHAESRSYREKMAVM